MSCAVVTGPTPPGTGVTAAAIGSTAAVSTSPVSPPSAVALVPTSITTAPGATWSGPISCGRPAATTRISAVRHTWARFRVREWHTVTVALAASSNSAAGLPTTVDRPTTTAGRPSGSTCSAARISITAAAVAGANTPGTPAASPPSEAGLAPSTSLATAIRAPAAAEVRPPGSGAGQMIPCTAGSADSSVSLFSTSAGRGRAGPLVRLAFDPDPVRQPLQRAHVPGRAGIVGRHHDGQHRGDAAIPEGGGVAGRLLADGRGDGPPVDDPRGLIGLP